LGETAHRLVMQGAGRARRHVVEQDRQADGIMDDANMTDDALLRRAQVVRRHAQQGLRAGALGLPRQADGGFGAAGARAGDDRHATMGRGDGDLDQPLVLFEGQQGSLASRAARHEG
jgi:hypothetical protein